MMRASLSPRLSPRLLLPAAALLALAALFFLDAAPFAQANHTLAAPANVRATVGDKHVTVHWDVVSGADTYTVVSDSDGDTSTTADQETATVTGRWTFQAYFGLTNGKTYSYRVQASDSGGNHTQSAFSGWITATPSRSFTLWSGRLTVGSGGTWRGYGPSSVGTLPDASFTYDGVDYEIERLSVVTSNGTLQLVLDKAIPDKMKSALAMNAGHYGYTLSSGTQATLGGTTNDSVTWANSGRNWNVGDQLYVNLNAADHWSATLPVRDLLSGLQRGCDDTEGGDYCSSHLTDNTFTYGGAEYQVVGISSTVASGNLSLAFDKTVPDSLDNLVLYADGRRFVLGDGGKSTAVNSNDTMFWENVHLGWSVGDTVELRLTERQPPKSHVYFPTHTETALEHGAHGLRYSNLYLVYIDPPLESASSVLVQIKSGATATQGDDYVIALPDYPGTTDTKVLRLPAGESEVSFGMTFRPDLRTEGEEAFELQLLPVPEAPYRVYEDTGARRYTTTEFALLDSSQRIPAEADPRRAIALNPRVMTAPQGGTTIWSATLTVQDDGHGNVGCGAGHVSCDSPSVLTNGKFSFGPEYSVRSILLSTAALGFQLDKAPPSGSWSEFKLLVDGTPFRLGDAVVNLSTFSILSPGLSWSGGDTVELSLVAAPTWGVYLATEPTGEVEVQAYIDGPSGPKQLGQAPSGEMKVTPESLTFDSSNYWQWQYFTLDPGDAEPGKYVIVHGLYNPDDLNYDSGSGWFIGPGIDGQTHVTVTVLGDNTQSGDPGGAYWGDLPTAVTLALGQDTVSESAGGVTLTATLDAPAPPGGLSLPLYPLQGGTADQGADYTLPESIAIPAGQRSGSVRIGITDDTLEESGETAVISVYLDFAGRILYDSVTLTIEDDDAPQQGQDPPGNQAPTVDLAIADATITSESGTRPVSLSGVFSDADNDPLTITAASSDTAVATVSVAADYSSLTLTAQSRGTATITVTASDGNGGTVSDAFTVTVKAAPTVASALADLNLEPEANHEVSLSGVFSDPDGDALVITASSSDADAVPAYVWADTLTVVAAAAGAATITVTAEDSDGNTVSDAFDVTVAAPQQQQQDPPPNRAPTVASVIADATITSESGTREVSLSGVFADADNDPLTITAASSDAARATVSVAADYSSLTVTAQARGTATITVTADDGNGGTVQDAFTVTVKAAPVVASGLADVSGLEEGSTRDVSLSGVFSDADGDALTITAASSDSAVATGMVAANGSTLTLAGVAEGTATVTVTAQDTDGNQVSDSFDVTVTAAPPEEEDDPPVDGGPAVAAPIADFSLAGPEHRVIDLSDVFSGEGLRFTAVSSNYRVASMWVDGTTLTVVGTGTGTATITVTAKDPDGNEVSDEFDVTVSPAS